MLCLEDPVHVPLVGILWFGVPLDGGRLHGVGSAAAVRTPGGQVLEHALVVQPQHLLQALWHRV